MRCYLMMFVLGCASSAPVQQTTEPAPTTARPIDAERPPVDAAPPSVDAPAMAAPPVDAAPAAPIPALADFERPKTRAGALSIGFDSEKDAEIRIKGGYFARTKGDIVSDPNKTFTVALRDEHGGLLPTLSSTKRDDAAFVIGAPGTPYTLDIKNTTKRDLEILVSIGFVDVFSGQYNQGTTDYVFTVRGALVPPDGEIHLVGIQQKTDRFNALQIPSPPSSAGYGSRGGAGGVIGRPPARIRIAAYAKR